MYNCLKEKKNLNLVSWIETHSNDDEKKRINMDEVEKYEWNSFDPVVNFVYTNREKKIKCWKQIYTTLTCKEDTKTISTISSSNNPLVQNGFYFIFTTFINLWVNV